MQDTESSVTCTAKTTIVLSNHTEADVQCGKEPHGPEEAHTAKQSTHTKATKTKPSSYARIIFTWH